MVDFSTLTAGTGTEADLKRSASEGKWQNHPVLNLLAESFAEKNANGVGTPRFYDVAESDVDEIEKAVRGCAMALDIGYRFVPKTLPNGQVRCTFAGKDKKAKLTPEQRAEREREAQAKRDERTAKREQREREAAEAKAKKEAEKAATPRKSRGKRS